MWCCAAQLEFFYALYVLMRVSDLYDTIWGGDVLAPNSRAEEAACVSALRALAAAVEPALPLLVSMLYAHPTVRFARDRDAVVPVPPPPMYAAGEVIECSASMLLLQFMVLPVITVAARHPSNARFRLACLGSEIMLAIGHAFACGSVKVRMALLELIQSLSSSDELLLTIGASNSRLMFQWMATLEHSSIDLRRAAIRALRVFFSRCVAEWLLRW